MGDILVILFQLPHAPSTLANCYRMRCLRQQSATACAVYACNLLPYVPSTPAKCYRMRRLRLQFATVCAVYASKTHNFTRFCYRMRRVRQQIATLCAVYASNLLPHAPHTLANCYRMRCLRQQFATAYAAYASKVLPHAPSTLTNSKYKCYSCLFQAMKQVFLRFLLYMYVWVKEYVSMYQNQNYFNRQRM